MFVLQDRPQHRSVILLVLVRCFFAKSHCKQKDFSNQSQHLGSLKIRGLGGRRGLGFRHGMVSTQGLPNAFMHTITMSAGTGISRNHADVPLAVLLRAGQQEARSAAPCKVLGEFGQKLQVTEYWKGWREAFCRFKIRNNSLEKSCAEACYDAPRACLVLPTVFVGSPTQALSDARADCSEVVQNTSEHAHGSSKHTHGLPHVVVSALLTAFSAWLHPLCSF